MDYEFEQSPLSKGILVGLFAGIVATCLCLLFDIVYRMITGFAMSELINVSSIIFITNLLLLVLGLIYFALKRAFTYGGLICIVGFILLGAFTVYKAEFVERSTNPEQSAAFAGLLIGLLIIIGLCSFLLLPLLYTNKWFNKHVV